MIAASQLATGYGIFIVLRRMRFDTTQCAVAAAIWVLSPFAVTSCFHYFSYEIFPYQLTVACALVLQLAPRPATVICLTLLGAMIAWTGESHLVASPLILVAVVAGTPMPGSIKRRIALTSVPLAATAIAVVAHRWIWSLFPGDYDGHVRFALAIPTASESIARFERFFQSVLFELARQLLEIVTLGGIWATLVAMVILGTAYYYWPRATSSGHMVSSPLRGHLPPRTTVTGPRIRSNHRLARDSSCQPGNCLPASARNWSNRSRIAAQVRLCSLYSARDAYRISAH